MDITVDVGQNATVLAEKLANIIGVTVDKIFPWYVDQVFVSAVCDLVSFITFLSITLIFLIIGLRKADFSESNANRYAALSVICGIFFIGASILFLCNLSSIITQISNPEYYAVKNMMTQLSTLK